MFEIDSFLIDLISVLSKFQSKKSNFNIISWSHQHHFLESLKQCTLLALQSVPCMNTLYVPELIAYTHGTLTVALRLSYPALLLSGTFDV